MRVRDDERVDPIAGEAVAHARELGGRGLARELERVQRDGPGRRRGPVRPDRIDGIAIRRDEAGPAFAAALARASTAFTVCSQGS
jgi:hypothetical protein